MDSPRRLRDWIAHAAATWALIFGVLHFVWAGGWYIGLDPVAAKAAFAVPWKLAYDLVAGVMCFVAAPVALALVMPWGRRVPRRLLSSIAWAGIGLLVLRAVASIVQVTYFVLTGRFTWRALGIWEPWFYVGATLFALTLWQYQREKTLAG
jgi:hypothetical protein